MSIRLDPQQPVRYDSSGVCKLQIKALQLYPIPIKKHFRSSFSTFEGLTQPEALHKNSAGASNYSREVERKLFKRTWGTSGIVRRFLYEKRWKLLEEYTMKCVLVNKFDISQIYFNSFA